MNTYTFLAVLQENIATVLFEDNDQTIQDIESRLNEMQQELLQVVNAKADYQKVADEIYRLRDLKQSILTENAEHEGKRERIAEMAHFLNGQEKNLMEYDEQLVRRCNC